MSLKEQQLTAKLNQQKQKIIQYQTEKEHKQQICDKLMKRNALALDTIQEIKNKNAVLQDQVDNKANEDAETHKAQLLKKDKLLEIEKEKNSRHLKDIESFKQKQEQEKTKIDELQKSNQVLITEFQKKQHTDQDGKVVETFNIRKTVEDYAKNSIKSQKQLDKKSKQLTDLHVQMENILAENRVLRRLAGVPENYGFDLEEIKAGEKQKIEDYKTQVMWLEKEVEELEAERTILRQKLRSISTMFNTNEDDKHINRYKGMSLEQLAKLDSYAQVLVNYPDADFRDEEQSKTKIQHQLTDLKRENESLRAKLNKMDEDYPTQTQYSHTQPINNDQQEVFLKAIDDKLNTLKSEMANVQKQPVAQQVVSQVDSQPQQAHYTDQQYRPPRPKTNQFGDKTDYRKAYSFLYHQDLETDLSEYQDEGGIDKLIYSHNLAALQVINIEHMRLNQKKDEELEHVKNQIESYKEQAEINLMVQDKLFKEHYEQINEKDAEIKDQTKQLNNFASENKSLKEQQKAYKELTQDLKADKFDETQLRVKYAQLMQKCAIMDINLVKFARKCQALTEEAKEKKDYYDKMEQEYGIKEIDLIKQIRELMQWKDKATYQLTYLLELQQKSVDQDLHEKVVNERKILNDQLAQFKIELSKFRKDSQGFETAERQINRLNEDKRELEQNLVEISLEQEIYTKRLMDKDEVFAKYISVYDKLIINIKNKHISPLEQFKNIDSNKDGTINKNEFRQAFAEITLDEADVDLIYDFIDLDGSGTIEYEEFMRKLKRSGVFVKKQEELMIEELYNKLQEAGYTIDRFFEIIDDNGNKQIEKKELKEGLKKLDIECNDQTIDTVFKYGNPNIESYLKLEDFKGLFKTFMPDQKFDVHHPKNITQEQQIMLKVNDYIVTMNLTVEEFFRTQFDVEKRVVYQDFEKFFKKVKIDDGRIIRRIFDAIDVNGDLSIEYAELLKYIKHAQDDRKQYEKIQKITDQTNKLVENQSKEEQHEYEEKVKGQNEIGRLTMKVQILTLKENQNLSKIKTMKIETRQQEEMIKKLKVDIDDQQRTIQEVSQQFYQKSAENQNYQIQLKNCETREKSEKLRQETQRLEIENLEHKAAMKTFKSLYESAITQYKMLKISQGRKKDETENLNEVIKELQTCSDSNLLIGKLYHKIMNLQQSNAQIQFQIEKRTKEINDLKSEKDSIKNQKEDLEETYIILRKQMNDEKNQSQTTITELKNQIIPTVSKRQIQEMDFRIQEISCMKSELEVTNRKLIEENYELELHKDQLITHDKQVKALERDLRYNRPDEQSQKIFELSRELQNMKIDELKAKREGNMAKEKQDYIQKLNRAQLDDLKKLENILREEQANWKLREKKYLEDYQKVQNKLFTKEAFGQKKDFMFKDGMGQSNYERDAREIQMEAGKVELDLYPTKEGQQPSRLRTMSSKRSMLESEFNNKGKEDYAILQKQNGTQEVMIDDLRKQLTQLQEEHDKHKREAHIIQNQFNVPSSDPEEYKRKAISEVTNELENHAQVTRNAISSMEEMINEKTKTIQRRDQQIKKLQQEYLQEKNKDTELIKNLHLEINKLKTQYNDELPVRGSDTIGKQSLSGQSEYWGNVEKLISEKDDKIEELQKAYDELVNYNRKQKKINKELDIQLHNLEDTLEIEKGRNSTEKLQKEIDTQKKSLFQKDKQIKEIKDGIKKMKDNFFEQQETYFNKEEEDKNKQDKLEKDKNLLANRITQYLKDIKQMNLQIRDAKDQQEKFSQLNIGLRGENSELKDQLKKNKIPIKETQISKSLLETSLTKSGKEKLTDKDKDIIKKLQQELEEAKAQIKALNKKQDSIIDNEGFVFSEASQFITAEQIIKRIKPWLNSFSIDICKELHQKDIKGIGKIETDDFYSVLKKHGLEFKVKDKELLDKAFVVQVDLQKLAEENYLYSKKMKGKKITSKIEPKFDLIAFYYKYYDKIKNDESTMKSNVKVDELALSLKEQKQQLQKSKTIEKKPSQILETSQTEDHKIQKELSRKLLSKQDQCETLAKEKIDLQKEVKLWKQKVSQLTNELSNSEYLVVDQKTLISSDQGLNPNADFEIKEKVFNLEQEKRELEDANKVYLVELKRFDEDRKLKEKEFDKLTADNIKLTQAKQDAINSKLTPGEIEQQQKSEQIKIINTQQKHLEHQRKKEDSLIEKVYELENKNNDLNQIKINYDADIKRLSRRINELEESKQSKSAINKTIGKSSKSPNTRRGNFFEETSKR